MAKHGWTGATAAIWMAGVCACWAGIAPAERGAVVETPSYRATFRDGVLVGFVNRFTQEEYLDAYADLKNIVPHLPGGLGTQATDAEREAAFTLFKWPWWEHPATAQWLNQHCPDAGSKCEFKAKDDSHATVTYTDLTDGNKRYADETFALDLAIDADTGDLLVTPQARSPRQGVYSSALTLAALAPAITAEAPVFDGLRLDRNMKPMLWVNQWGGYWDYAFLAFNGYKKGAVAVWCQDPELKFYKYLFYLINQEGISFSFCGMNLPPFDGLTEAAPVTWRIQAFDKGWSQAVARFREWRLKNVKIAPRPEWARHISFVNGGVNASKGWLDLLGTYFGPSNLDHTITFGATVRGEGFDQNHANNTPYAGFKDDMKLWKEKGAKFMSYLQPMIMWGPKPKTERETQGVEAHKKADTVMVFQAGKGQSLPYIDQHHLGQPDWQRWFLDWVKEYIQDYGSDGVYHDQSYHCPVDSRGLAIAGKTSTQGMSDYFYKAATESPDSIHGTEHMTEVNNVGASLGIASGILWGTAECMRKQRIDHPSPICNALHYPNGALFAFPHYSQINCGSLERIHWGMNLSEGRGELAYAALQGPDPARTQGLANERWMDVVRSLTFVHRGLRAVFPEDWDRNVLSYFKGVNGEDFRYVKTPWGSAFVEIAGATTNLLYGRIHGTPYAQAEGGIAGWPLYNAKGPAGLHPNRYYVLDPNAKRPAVYFSSNNQFSPSLYEGFVDEGFVTDDFAYLKIKPREDIMNIITYDSVILNARETPRAVYVNGVEAKPQPVTNGQWKIDFQLSGPVAIIALLREFPEGFDKIAAGVVGRTVADDWTIDQYLPGLGTNVCKALTNGFSCDKRVVLAPIRCPADQGDGTLKLSFPGSQAISKVEFDGMEKPLTTFVGTNKVTLTSVSIPKKAKAQGLLSVRSSSGRVTLNCEWIPNVLPAAVAPVAAK